jgi:hypothetical protein
MKDGKDNNKEAMMKVYEKYEAKISVNGIFIFLIPNCFHTKKQ